MRSGSRIHSCVLIALAMVTGGCDGTTEPGNQPPLSVSAIPDQKLEEKESVRFALSAYFTDPDGGALTYEATTSDIDLATASVSSDTLTIVAVAPGSPIVTVTARDSQAQSAQQRVRITITPRIPRVGFETPLATAPEGGVVVLEVSIDEPPATSLLVHFKIGVDNDPSTHDADNLDHAGGDRGRVVIPSGETNARIEIPIRDDQQIEPAREVFTITLEESHAGAEHVVGDVRTATAIIAEGVCDRTPVIRDYILADIGAADCTAVTQDGLADVLWIHIVGQHVPVPEDEDSESNRHSLAQPGQLPTAPLTYGPHGTQCPHDPDRVGIPGYRLPGSGSQCPPTRTSVAKTRPKQPSSEGFSRNTVATLRVGDFAGLVNLRRLNLMNLGLVDLPVGIFSDLSQVTFMSLQGNRLTTLTPGIFEGLSNLNALQLTANPYAHLASESFGGLPRLKSLELRVTPLTDLRSDLFSKIPTLSWLSLQGNRLKRLSPALFSYLPDLEYLFLRNNEIESLPADLFEASSRLRTLELWTNRIRELPVGVFSELSSLETLDLRANHLQTLTAGALVGLRSLGKLALDGNPGAPFQFKAVLVRTDGDPLAPGPAKATVRVAYGAPFPMVIRLATVGGSVSPDFVQIEAGRISGQEIVVTREAGHDSGTQVIAGPIPEVPPHFQGIELDVSDPLVLFDEVSNLAPVPERTISWQRLSATGDRAVTASRHFRDPEGAVLTYAAVSGALDVVSVSVEDGILTLHPGRAGSAMVTVTAADPGGLSAESSFRATVRQPIPGSFDIDLILVGVMTASLEAVFIEAADHWMSILAATELPDVPMSEFPVGCGDIVSMQNIEAVDEIVIVASVDEVDGLGGVLASAGVCGIRAGRAGLPFMGAMSFDADDLERLLETGDAREVILHEIAHSLGIGTVWQRQGLLRDPSLLSTDEMDTHFAGALAIRAFEDAGGARYTSAKVPVENRAGPGAGDVHWRESVLERELMTPFQNPNVRDPLSSITIQSLADLGYTVDITLAEPFMLGTPAMLYDAAPAPRITYGPDVVRWPVVVVDRTGRVVEVVPD